MLSKDEIDQNVKIILDTVSDSAYGDIKVYLVGGAVRDIILNSTKYVEQNNSPFSRKFKINDLDFVVFGVDYIKFAHIVAKKFKSVAIPFKENMRIPLHGTTHGKTSKAVNGAITYSKEESADRSNVLMSNIHLDISAPRGSNIYEDLQMRDFTINNLALDLNRDSESSKSGWFAVIGDRTDLDSKVINPVKEDVFDIDPVRILRGFRQAISLDFKLGDIFLSTVVKKVDLLAEVAYERVQEELRKMSLSRYDNADKVRYLKYIEEYGIWLRLFNLDVDSNNIIGVSDKEFLGREVDNYLSHVIKGAGGSDTIYTADDIHFSIFLSALFHKASSSELDDRLKLLLVSNKVRKLTNEILGTAKDIHKLKEMYHIHNLTSEGDFGDSIGKDKAMKQIVWRSCAILPFVLFVAEKLYNVDSVTLQAYKEILCRMDLLSSELISGEDILKIAANIAPDLKGGKWISELLEDVKIKLAFLELRSKDDAVVFITAYLKLLIRGEN